MTKSVLPAARSFSVTVPIDDGQVTIEVQPLSWLWVLLQLALADDQPFRFRNLLAGEWGNRHPSDPYTGGHELRVRAVLDDPYGKGSKGAEIYLREVEIG